MIRKLLSASLCLALAALLVVPSVEAKPKKTSSNSSSSKSSVQKPVVTAKSAVILNGNGGILYSKNPHLRLPPASTTKVMTALVVMDRLKMDKMVTISKRAWGVAPSKAGLVPGAQYSVKDLLTAILVASSNDAAVALAEATAGSEWEFVTLMNQKAKKLGMNNTRFVNASGLTDKKRTQYSTAYDLALLMRQAVKNKWIDQTMAVTKTSITGSDGTVLPLRAHNKMLWKTPGYVKGKTGWTYASRHTFVGTNYEPKKKILFAMLHSQEPWVDIKKLANFGLSSQRR